MKDTIRKCDIENFYADSLTILELVERLSEEIQPLFLGKRFYTDAQLADKLNISRRTLQEYRDNGLIAYYRLDGKILYADDDVETFLKSTYTPIDPDTEHETRPPDFPMTAFLLRMVVIRRFEEY